MSPPRDKSRRKLTGQLISRPAPDDNIKAGPPAEVLCYDPDGFEEKVMQSPSQLRQFVGLRRVTWVNMDGIPHESWQRQLSEIFRLHELALEDAVNVQQRAKVDEYPDHIYVVLRMVSPGESGDTEQLSIFLSRTTVLTIQERPGGDCLDTVRDKVRRGQGRIRSESADYLMYAIVDAVVDGYFPLLESLGERIESLEDEILENAPSSATSQIHEIKRDLLAIRKMLWPLRDALGALCRDTHPMISATTRTYLRDCYDHVLRLIDLLEMYRELTHDLMDIYLTTVNNRMNEVMKVLTIITTLFIPPTLIAGIYGMNFDPGLSPWNMPELGWYFGYPMSLALMVLVSLGLLYYLHRRGWVLVRKS